MNFNVYGTITFCCNSLFSLFKFSVCFSKKGNNKVWIEQIDKACDPEDVSDLEIFVVYPVDKKTDDEISKAATFWTDYFVSKGADDETFHFDTGIDL